MFIVMVYGCACLCGGYAWASQKSVSTRHYPSGAIYLVLDIGSMWPQALSCWRYMLASELQPEVISDTLPSHPSVQILGIELRSSCLQSECFPTEPSSSPQRRALLLFRIAYHSSFMTQDYRTTNKQTREQALSASYAFYSHLFVSSDALFQKGKNTLCLELAWVFPVLWESNPFIANIRSRPEGPQPPQLSLVSSYFSSIEKLKLTNCLGRCAALCCLFLSRTH